MLENSSLNIFKKIKKKRKKLEYCRKHHKNFSEDEKQKLVKYKILQNVKKRFIIIIRKYFIK